MGYGSTDLLNTMSFRNELRSRIIDNEELYKHLTRDEFNNKN